MPSFNSSRLASAAWLVVGLSLLGLMLLAAWAGFSQHDVSFVAVAACLGLAMLSELLFWRRMATRQDAEADARGDKRNRVTAMIGRPQGSRQSIRDESTGLYHRWYLETRLEQEAARCQRYKHSMAVVVFKAGVVGLADMSVDTWQQRSIDAAQQCLQVVRNIDLSAALGPLEFAICLVQCDQEGAQRALARLVERMSDYECNAGVAVYPDDDCDPPALIELARMRLHPMAAAA